MGMRTKVLATLALVGAGALLSLPSAAGAAVPSGVTIHFRHQEFVGFVFSQKPHRCANERFISLYRQNGKKQHPNRDDRLRVARAKGPDANHKYKWTLPRRSRPGKFYARITPIPDCQGDTSKTIHVAGVTANGAMATTKHFKAEVSLSRNDPFHGHVSSTFCHKNRTVKVFRQRVIGDRHFGKTKTDHVGRWAIDAHHVHGKFYARVTRVVKHRADGTKVVCDTDRSATHSY